jgi:hypothetical protein
VRFQTTRVPWPLMNGVPDHKLVFCPHLHVISRLLLSIAHVIFFHPHERRIFICL